MTIAKSTAVVLAANTNVAAGGQQASPWIDLRAAYKASLLVRVTNGATGPTLPARAVVNLSPDGGTTVYAGAGGSAQADRVAGSSYAWQFPQQEDVMYAQVVVTGNTGQAVTTQADVTQLIAL